MAEHVVIETPLHTRHASTVRAVAASVGSDAGFAVDDIDDLRLGVNEAVSILADVDAAPDARLRVLFVLSAGEVVVRCSRIAVADVLEADHVDELATRILGAVLDDFAVTDGEFVFTKRSAPS